MTYRAVVRHVRYWRGLPQRWSTVYQFVGTPTMTPDTAACHAVLTADDNFCYKTTAANGGSYECSIYNTATGGVPIANYTAFDWTAPGTWIGYNGAYWTTTGLLLNGVAEAALQVEWIGGLSHSGKPVYMRKWYHAVPAEDPTGNAVQVGTADHTSLLAGALAFNGVLASYGLVHGSSSGRIAGVPTVRQYYGAHQMPRGRRRKPLVTSSGRYTGPTVTIPDTIPD